VWCLPVLPSKLSQTHLNEHELTGRMIDLPRGIVPSNTACVTVGVDLGKFLCHWIAVAWSANPTVGHVLDYDRIEVPSDSMALEQALMIALRQLKEMFIEGWPVGEAAGQHAQPSLVLVDSGYMAPVVYAFCRESGERFRPAIGRGASQQYRNKRYNRPVQGGGTVYCMGEEWHANVLPAENLLLVQANADYWKTWFHQRLTTPLDKPGAMTLFKAQAVEHLSLGKHLTAERKTEEFIAGKGVITKWERIRRQNHWFDALYNACVAGHACGVKLVDEKVAAPPQVPAPRVSYPDWVDPKEWLNHGRDRW
jgi:Terminase large subunit gpA, endonuclease domain